MKVNDPNLTNVASEALRGTGADRAQQSQQTQQIGRRGSESGAAAGVSPDTFALSGLSAELRVANQDSPERVARLEKLGDDVAAGKYQADPVAVSRSIIESALRPSV